MNIILPTTSKIAYKKKIAIDSGDFTHGEVVRSGITRLLAGFFSEIEKRDRLKMKFYYYHFGQNNFFANKISYQKNIVKITLPKFLFSSFFLTNKLLIDNINVFIGFSGYVPKRFFYSKIKRIVFIYDLGFVKYPNMYIKAQKLLSQTERSLRSADKIIVLADYTKKIILNNFNKINPDKIIRIYPGTEHILNSDIVSEGTNFFKYNKSFFLYVGVVKPVKNIERIFRYFASFLRRLKENNTRLIIVGAIENDYFNKLIKDMNYIMVKDRVHFISSLSDFELSYLYKHCIALLNSSLEEGFCFPIHEVLVTGGVAIVNELGIYKEFSKFYKNLYICKDSEGFISSMLTIYKKQLASNYRRKKGRVYFRWKDFTDSLIKITDSV